MHPPMPDFLYLEADMEELWQTMVLAPFIFQEQAPIIQVDQGTREATLPVVDWWQVRHLVAEAMEVVVDVPN